MQKNECVGESFVVVLFFFPQECFYLFIFDCSGSLLLQVGSSPAVASKGRCLLVGHFCLRAWAVGLIGFSSCDTWTQQLWFPGSRAQVQYLWHTGPIAGRHMVTSRIRDRTHLLHWQEDSSPLSNQGSLLTSPPPSWRVLIFSSVKPVNSFAFQVESTGFLWNWSEVHRFGI